MLLLVLLAGFASVGIQASGTSDRMLFVMARKNHPPIACVEEWMMRLARTVADQRETVNRQHAAVVCALARARATIARAHRTLARHRARRSPPHQGNASS